MVSVNLHGGGGGFGGCFPASNVVPGVALLVVPLDVGGGSSSRWRFMGRRSGSCCTVVDESLNIRPTLPRGSCAAGGSLGGGARRSDPRWGRSLPPSHARGALVRVSVRKV